MTIDRKTLELAAKAAGFNNIKYLDTYGRFFIDSETIWLVQEWCPHINTYMGRGQLLDLAMACKIRIDPDANLITWYIPEQMTFRHAGVDCQDFPALAEAVIQAAAEQQLVKEDK